MKHSNFPYAAARLSACLSAVVWPMHALAADAPSQAADGKKAQVNLVLVDTSYYEYQDGTSRIGRVTKTASRAGYVTFTDCNMQSSDVPLAQLQATTARCSKGKDVPVWSLWTDANGSVLPVYRASTLPADTHIVFADRKIDIAPFLKANGTMLPAASTSVPIGYVLKDAKGMETIGVVKDQKYEAAMPPGLGAMHKF